MYRYYAVKRNPTALWNLDSALPFKESAGLGYVADKKPGSGDPGKAVGLTTGSSFSSVFTKNSVGRFSAPFYTPGNEKKSFAIEAWVLQLVNRYGYAQQQVLCHDNTYDGIHVSERIVSFSMDFEGAETLFCNYTMDELGLYHIVATHNENRNELWVNGVLRASVELNENQKAASFVSNDGYLYSGWHPNSSNPRIAINSVAFYNSLSGEQIKQNYQAGIDKIGVDRTISQFTGQKFQVSSDASYCFSKKWKTKEDYYDGFNNNTQYSDDTIFQTVGDDGIGQIGSWTASVALDAMGDTSIYGAAVYWDGYAETATASIDGTTWVSITKGDLVSNIVNETNPTGKDLRINFEFQEEIANEQGFVKNIKAIVFRNNSVNNTSNLSTRTAFISQPAAPLDSVEPMLLKEHNGIRLNGGSLTIGPDTSNSPLAARTLELWIKPVSTVNISVDGTKYRNGAADTSLPVGEWSLIHYVASSDITTDIVVSGQAVISSVVLYPTALTAQNVAHLYNTYMGGAVQTVVDSSAITVTEPATPSTIYSHTWSITAAG